jgi:hypothetical protein
MIYILVCNPRSARVALPTATNHKILLGRNKIEINNAHQGINSIPCAHNGYHKTNVTRTHTSMFQSGHRESYE